MTLIDWFLHVPVWVIPVWIVSVFAIAVWLQLFSHRRTGFRLHRRLQEAEQTGVVPAVRRDLATEEELSIYRRVNRCRKIWMWVALWVPLILFGLIMITGNFIVLFGTRSPADPCAAGIEL